MHSGIVFVIVCFVIVIGIFAWMRHHFAKQRTLGMQSLASSLGLQFTGGKDYSFDERYDFVNKLCQGKKRYAYNIIHGIYYGHHVLAFDYHYQTESRNSNGKKRTQHHHFSFFVLHFEGNFPELLISREGWLSKVAQFFGFDDINFESAEFNRMFKVKSANKQFAYDICHGQMIEFLLSNPDLNIEIEQDCLTLFFGSCLDHSQITPNLNRLVHIRTLFPQYLFTR